MQRPPRLIGDASPFVATLETETIAPGMEAVRLVLVADEASEPPALAIEWREPLLDTACMWTSAAGRDKGLPPDWNPLRVQAKATSQAPLVCAVSAAGENRLLVACSEPLHPVELSVGVNEEAGELLYKVAPFLEAPEPARRFEVTLRLDRRPQPYEHALSDAARWWAQQTEAAPVPALARAPMYSTWYSFHQRLEPAAVEAECARAREFGCEAVIIDDGWQTLDAARGYAFTGDWTPERIPDMRGHVDRLHALGMRVLLWYSVPFVGMKSEAWARWRDKLLYTMPERGAGIVDPRYPEVRHWLIETWERAVQTWDLDGLKLDFVDRFTARPETPRGGDDGRDTSSIMGAVDRLLSEAMTRLSAVRPSILVEFRQPYIGPLMRRYGNMFRANDCPADAIRNRVSIADLRLLHMHAVHGDMLMWNPSEPVEAAALQLLAVLFAVPQISVRLGELPEPHVQMLRFWLDFWRAHEATLLDGEFRAHSPELNYPLLSSTRDRTHIVAAYADVVVPLPLGPDIDAVYVVNATRQTSLVVTTTTTTRARVRVRDCCGGVTREEPVSWSAGAHVLEVPAAGLLEVTAQLG